MHHRQLDLGPVEVADHDLGIAQPKAPADLAAHGRRRGGRERYPHRCAQLLSLRSKPQVVRPEVPTPLADEVRLIDDEQSRACAAQHRAGLVIGELLGRDEHELVGVGCLDERRRPGTRRLRGIQHGSPKPRLPKVRQLVGLQRYQRRHDDRRPRAQQAGKLIDRGLATAGGQRRQHVPACGGGSNGPLLARPQPLEPKPIAGQRADHHAVNGRHPYRSRLMP